MFNPGLEFDPRTVQRHQVRTKCLGMLRYHSYVSARLQTAVEADTQGYVLDIQQYERCRCSLRTYSTSFCAMNLRGVPQFCTLARFTRKKASLLCVALSGCIQVDPSLSAIPRGSYWRTSLTTRLQSQLPRACTREQGWRARLYLSEIWLSSLQAATTGTVKVTFPA